MALIVRDPSDITTNTTLQKEFIVSQKLLPS